MADDPRHDDRLPDHARQDDQMHHELMHDELMNGPMDDHEDELDEQALDRELADADDVLSSQLRELLDPADGLRERTAQDIDRSLRGRSSLAAALDLLGLGWWTARSLLGDDRAVEGTGDGRTLSSDPRRADPEGEGT